MNSKRLMKTWTDWTFPVWMRKLTSLSVNMEIQIMSVQLCPPKFKASLPRKHAASSMESFQTWSARMKSKRQLSSQLLPLYSFLHSWEWFFISTQNWVTHSLHKTLGAKSLDFLINGIFDIWCNKFFDSILYWNILSNQITDSKSWNVQFLGKQGDCSSLYNCRRFTSRYWSCTLILQRWVFMVSYMTVNRNSLEGRLPTTSLFSWLSSLIQRNSYKTCDGSRLLLFIDKLNYTNETKHN